MLHLYLQDLTWGIKYENNDGLSKADVRRVFSNALNKWAKVTNLKFTEVSSGEPDIWFKFVKGSHGDPFPFRIPYSNVLAHAFYPLDSKVCKYFSLVNRSKWSCRVLHISCLIHVGIAD